MTNYISDLILNSVQPGKEPAKTNQYQTRDNGPSFNDILDKVNKETAIQEQSKTTDNSLVKDKSNDEYYKKNTSVDDQNLKKDDDLIKKTVDKVKSPDVNNKTEPKNVVNKKTEKMDLDSTVDAKKSDSSKVEDKTDPAAKAAAESKVVVKDENATQIKDQESQDESTSDEDAQNSASGNSDTQTPDEKTNSKTNELPVATVDVEQTSDDVQASSDVQAIDALAQLLPQAVIPTQPEVTTDASTTQSISAKDASEIQVVPKQASEEIKPGVDPLKNLIINATEVTDNTNKTSTTIAPTSADEVDSSLQIKVSNDVQVNTENIINDKNTTEVKDKTKDEIPLDQAILNELDAEVTDSSQNSGNSFLKQQNASEQIIKLSIEPLVKPDSVEFSNIVNQDKIMPATIDKPQLNVLQAPVKGLNQLDVMNQINDKLTTFKSSANEKIEIILKPENLGKVNVEIQSIKGVISATFVAESQQVKEILEKNMDSLRNNLSSQGLSLNNLSVKVEEPTKSAFNNLNFGQGQFDSEANNHQQKSQNTYKSDYKDNMSSESLSKGTEEGTISSSELKNDNSLHVGMVDYKV